MSAQPVSCDSSVLIAALSPWHPAYPACIAALDRVTAIPAHALLETYSVMTRMPKTQGVDPRHAAAVLTDQPWEVLQLPAERYEPLIHLFAEAGRGGGAIYDAQIAATAKHHGCTLLSRDRRAVSIYELVGVEYQLVG